MNNINPIKIGTEELRGWKDNFFGQSCILMCNGPSLNQVDFESIDRDRFTVFGLNKIFLGFEKFNFEPDFLVAINKLVLEQSSAEYKSLTIPKFLSNRVAWDSQSIPPNTFLINTTQLPINADRFSTDISSYVHEGWTVTHAALQIIYYMGFNEVNIIGMDHMFQQHVKGKENKKSIISGPDLDHFAANYFGYGQEWDFPDLENSEVSYKRAREVFEKTGRSIYDCTEQGHCHIFEKAPISKLYKNQNNRNELLDNDQDEVDVSFIILNEGKNNCIDQTINSIDFSSMLKIEVLIFNSNSPINDTKTSFFNDGNGSYLKVVNVQREKSPQTPHRYFNVAAGKYICFLQSVDQLSKTFVNEAIEIFGNNSQIQHVTGRGFVSTESGYKTGLMVPKHLTNRPNPWFGRAIISRRSCFHGTNSKETVISQLSSVDKLFQTKNIGFLKNSYSTHVLDPLEYNPNLLEWIVENFSQLNSLTDNSPDKSHENRELIEIICRFFICIIFGDTDNARLILSDLSLKLGTRGEKLDDIDCYHAIFNVLFGLNFDCDIEDVKTIPKNAILALMETAKLLNLASCWPRFLIYLSNKFGRALDTNPKYPGYFGLNKSIPRELKAQFNTLDFVLQVNRHFAICSSELAIDVGAHHGSSTKVFRNAGLRVLAFEPDQKNLQKLTEKFAHDKGVLIDKRALGLCPDEECDFYESDVSHGISSKIPFHESHRKIGTVSSTNLSNVYKNYKIDHVGILKIDAEGADYSILRGLPWESDNPDVIICEFEDKKTEILGVNHSVVCEFLCQKGYNVLISEWHPIERYGVQHDWRGLKLFPCSLHDQNAWGDILAFKSKLDTNIIEAISWQNTCFLSN